MQKMAKLILGSLLIAATACGGVDSSEYDGDESFVSADLTQAQNRDIARARAASARYHDLQNAIDDGFVDTGLPCFDGQGFHWIRVDRINTYNVEEPAILVYAPDGKLGAVEWATPVDAVGGVRPVLFGETFHGPVLDPPLYVLHVWAWNHNTDGMFDDDNPRISCN